MNALNYYWRLIATGLSFAIFGLGGLALTLLVFPLFLIFPGQGRVLRARRVIQKSFALFIWFMKSVGIMQFEVVGANRLRDCRNTLILANHPTLIDVVALISLMPDATCVVKQALWRNPFLSGVVRAAKYISNSEPHLLVDDCAAAVAAGTPLVIFPEGTRTRPGKPLRFLRGASYIALKSRLPILPVLITCDPSTLSKRERWYQIPDRAFHLRVEVREPIDAETWVTGAESAAIAARRLTQGLETYFSTELARHGQTEQSQAGNQASDYRFARP
ncbi:MAG: lysophospholipid acyltransferase family protein [Ignavibacteria bacterium]